MITPAGSTEFNGNGSGAGTLSYDFNFDIGTLVDGLLVVPLGIIAGAERNIADLTWNGVSLGTPAVAVVREFTTSFYHQLYIYYKANPANGANTLTLSFDTIGIGITEQYSLLPSWWEGARQSSVKDQHNSAFGTTDPSVNITPTQDDELIVDYYISEANSVLTKGAEQTLLQEHDFGPRVVGSSYVIQSSLALQTMSWTGLDDIWDQVVASFKVASASPPGQTPPASRYEYANSVNAVNIWE